MLPTAPGHGRPAGGIPVLQGGEDVNKKDAPPLAETIRRGGRVYARLCGLSRSEIQSHNPRVIKMCKEDGYSSVELYRPAARPAAAQEMAAIMSV